MEQKDLLTEKKSNSDPIPSPFLSGFVDEELRRIIPLIGKELQIKSINLPKDLVEQVHTILHIKEASCDKMAIMISTVLFEARRRDKDSLIREINTVIEQSKVGGENTDILTILLKLTEKLKQN